MLRPTNAGNTMTFLTIITFNQLQSKPLVCMAIPLPPSWAVSQRNLLIFQATPEKDSGSTSACLWPWSEGTPVNSAASCSSRQSAPIRTSAKRKHVTRAWPHWTDWTNISDHIRGNVINISTEMGLLHVQKYILFD